MKDLPLAYGGCDASRPYANHSYRFMDGAFALRRTLSVLLAAAWLFIPVASLAQAAHPLDPLTANEIDAATQILRASGHVNTGTRFPLLALNEPPKAEVQAFQPGQRFRREAFAVVYERGSNKTFEAVVDLNARALLSWKEIPGVQPSLIQDDFALADRIVRADRRWQEAMRRRGIADLGNIEIQSWAAGDNPTPEEEAARSVRAVMNYKGQAANSQARPIEGVVAYVDLNAMRVTRLVDTGAVPVPKPADFDPEAIGRTRTPPRPLQIVQPQGESFTVNGNEVRWQNWRFRFALHPREGLVLYTVGYEDQGKLRSILYRASLSEMVVPYADPSPTWRFRTAFDQGEFGMGWLSASLEPGADAPDNARFFQAVLAGTTGAPYTKNRAVAVYERDGGVLWRHDTTSRRSRQLVVSYIATLGNYDYGFNWVFHQDGTLESEVLLTGLMLVKGVREGAAEHGVEGAGHKVGEGVVAVHHQHFFNFRLDLDVDGAANNTVLEMNSSSLPPGEENPVGNGFVMQSTPLRSELSARRTVNMASSRAWRVIQTAARNALGDVTGYALLPGENAVPFAQPGSDMRKRAGFLDYHLWVTPYAPQEMNAAGYYVNQSKGGDGLPLWTRGDRPVENQDVVLWYTVGVTHTPRPEEWPVMPVHKAGFKLVPFGFFNRNPALDVPRTGRN